MKSLNEVNSRFIALYGKGEEPRTFMSPGRVNMIGEHVDYNGGKVFPAALTLKNTIAVRENGKDVVCIAFTDLEGVTEIKISDLSKYKEMKYVNYPVSVMLKMQEAGYEIVGCDMLFHSTLPHGSGLSASASVCDGTALVFMTLYNEAKDIDKPVDMIELAKLCQKAEHALGVPCGIMDQFAVAMGKKDHAILLNCSDLKYEHVPFKVDGVKVIITNSNVKHALGDSAYEQRVKECKAALEVFKKYMPEKTCLADILPSEYEKYRIHLTLLMKIRAEHVVYECFRTEDGVEALKRGDVEQFGAYMFQSHDSLKIFYQVSCEELDILVEAAKKADGVIGSRMTGAGFGGCTVTLIKEESVEKFIEYVGKTYKEKTGIEADFYVTNMGDGAMEITDTEKYELD